VPNTTHITTHFIQTRSSKMESVELQIGTSKHQLRTSRHEIETRTILFEQQINYQPKDGNYTLKVSFYFYF